MPNKPAPIAESKARGATAHNVAALLLLIGLILFLGGGGGLGILFLIGGAICVIVGYIQKGSAPSP